MGKVVEAGRRFINDDACGDWVVPLGHYGLEFQVMNGVSAFCFVLAGAPLIFRASTPIARTYGLLMCCVGIGSFSYHATTTQTGFMIDIIPMAATAALLLYKATHALQADAGGSGHNSETFRLSLSIACALFAVYIPWVMMAAGTSHEAVWGVWAFLFGSMGAIFGVVACMVFVNEGVFWGQPGLDLVSAVVSVLLGLSCSIHSFIPGLCNGWRTALPLHALWHVCSAISSNRCGYILDTMSQLVSDMEDTTKARVTNKLGSLLVRLVKRDILPSQFSM